MAYKFNPFTSNFDYYESGSGGSSITVVVNYSALPNPTTVSGQFYWCSASQGTSWLPGSFGGTYYSAGLYYSNGVSWEFIDVPYQATQAEVNAGINTDKFVTPDTLKNSTQFQYLDAISSIQTQLDNNVYCVTLFNINNLSVVDSVTYYLGTSSAFGTTTNQIAFMPLGAGILRSVTIEVYSASTVGSSEGGTLTLYYNDGASSVVLTTALKVDADRHSNFNLTGFSTAMNNGNAYIEYIAPILATNPTAIQMRVNLFIQPT